MFSVLLFIVREVYILFGSCYSWRTYDVTYTLSYYIHSTIPMLKTMFEKDFVLLIVVTL